MLLHLPCVRYITRSGSGVHRVNGTQSIVRIKVSALSKHEHRRLFACEPASAGQAPQHCLALWVSVEIAGFQATVACASPPMLTLPSVASVQQQCLKASTAHAGFAV